MNMRRFYFYALACVVLICACNTPDTPASSKISGPSQAPVRSQAAIPVEPLRYAVSKSSSLPAELTFPLSTHDTYLQIRARINGQPMGMFLIDTGSAFNVVTPLIADQLRLPVGGAGAASGVGGVEAFTFRRAQSLSIGNLSLASLDLAQLEMYRFTIPLGQSVSGIIGFNAFGSAPFTIDYDGPTLTVYSPVDFQPVADEVAYPYQIRGGVPVVKATVGKGHSVWLIVDTGADLEITLPLVCAAAWPDIVAVPLSGRGQSRGIGGTISANHTWLTSLELFGVKLRYVPASFERPRGKDQSPGSSSVASVVSCCSTSALPLNPIGVGSGLSGGRSIRKLPPQTPWEWLQIIPCSTFNLPPRTMVTEPAFS